MGFFGNAWNALGDVGQWAYEEASIYRRKWPAQPAHGDAAERLRAADYRDVARVADISAADFAERYLMRSEPVIVSDGLRDWPARDIWGFDYFCREFGDMPVRLQDAGFKPRSEVELRAYLRGIASLPAVELGEAGRDLDYLRYTYDSFFKHLLFTWGFGHLVRTRSFSFLAFQRIRDHWRRPYFLPAGGYRIPWVQAGELRPNLRMCQDWGLYFSAPGACTRLHVDGMRSNAVLCQAAGHKAGWIFSASLEDAARSAAEGRATRAPSAAGRGLGGQADRIWRFDLGPGEIMLIPKGLTHEVHTLSPSISLTYNFVTDAEYPDYLRFKSERGPGWIAGAPISAAPAFERVYRGAAPRAASREPHLV
ncbi:cupin-like domain-containing protein [Chromobacterium subtsugae]|uniref:cupin-like domain-containing protein n=1 Tax=Chromobacterium subtsugae TaxID=251747 RepID=UPI000640E8B0|nr:cupin-like domain-containing protein [Chromobacterium subtsugae]